jgi:UDPglucose--hexose-1-phosphate uridylyltransferase
MSELRYHPFLDQWVITATHRQERTFHPPPDYCPLCPTKPKGFPTEVPFSSYDIVVFENKFPSLRPDPPTPEIEGTDLLQVRQSYGLCEVVLYAQEHNSTFAELSFSQVRKLCRVWRERYIELAQTGGIEYVFIFENKGKEIGVTLSHPHGQIYAYPYIPPFLQVELDAERAHYERHQRLLWDDWLHDELSQESGRREVWRNDSFVALVPFFARYPFEVWITSFEHLRSMREMSPRHLDDLAEILLVITRKYDKLFGFSMPYIMNMHQEPGVPGYDFTRFHVEFYPPYRTENKLKYLAGSEAGAGAFINDTLPEETSARLRDLDVGTVKS